MRRWSRSKDLKAVQPKETKKWGYRLYALSSDDELMYNFEIHAGKSDICVNQPYVGASENIVLIVLKHHGILVYHL